MKTLWIVVLVGSLCTLSACGMRLEAWKGGPALDIPQGMDFHIGFNNIDDVDNKRGTKPFRRPNTDQTVVRAKY